MTDREMLELAAKAVGISGYRYSENFCCMAHWNESDGGWFDACGLWDPLRDDGDALRLAVKMGIYVHCRAGSMVTSAIGDGDEWVIENWSNDPTSATRRAITRAAAQIGKEME